MNTQTMLDQISERVDYANYYYSHFERGWTSDMGRIHIRRGKPDDIEVGTSSDEARFVRKDYQIWKYQGRQKAVYLFTDIQMNGNYRLIYVEGDQRESSNRITSITWGRLRHQNSTIDWPDSRYAYNINMEAELEEGLVICQLI